MRSYNATILGIKNGILFAELSDRQFSFKGRYQIERLKANQPSDK